MAQGKYQRRRRRRLNPTFPIFVLMVLAVVIGLTVLLLRGCDADRPDDLPTDPTPTAPAVTDPPTDPTDPPTDPTEDPTEPTEETTAPTEPTEPPTEPTTEPTEETTEPTEEPTDPTEESAQPTGQTEPVPVGQQIADLALAQVGKPYLFGGSGPDAFDTTGLIHYCHREADVDVPRLLSAQAAFGTEVASQDDLQPGDVVFFWTETPGQADYPAIYVGGGKLVAAFRADVPVGEFGLNETYYAEHYVTARRFY